MSKLVLYLPDGSLHDIQLDKERLTIGRRPDNDICLPFPAVSGEHAAVVTILADSFLEDLGSTNGTLVNGQPVVKHFLRDNDHIDVGRQRLVYFMDDNRAAEPLAPDVLRREVIGLHEQVERAREMRGERKKAPAAPPAATAPSGIDPLFPDDELLSDLAPAVLPGIERVVAPKATLGPPIAAPAGRWGAAVPGAGTHGGGLSGTTVSGAGPSGVVSGSASSGPQSGPALSGPALSGPPLSGPAAAGGTPAAAMERHRSPTGGALAPPSKLATRLAATWTPVPEVDGLPSVKTLPAALLPRDEPAPPPVPSYRVRVLTGANAGRELAIDRDSVSVGSVGVQVARIARQDGTWRLAALEGSTPLSLNGVDVPGDGAVLCPGDHFEVAGVQLAFESA